MAAPTTFGVHPVWVVSYRRVLTEGRVGKVKCTLVQALRLCTDHRESRGIALLFLDHGTRRR